MKSTQWEVGASSCGHKEIKRELFEAYNRAGINKMEISLDYNCRGIDFIKEIYELLDIKAVKKFAADNGVDIWSYHLPFDHAEVNPASFDAEVRSRTVELDTQMISAAAELGAKVVVVHASGEPIDDKDRGESMKYSFETILKLNDAAKKSGVILAVENLPRTCLGRDGSEILKFLELDCKLGVCFDVNHLLSRSHKEFIAQTGKRIVTLHISDYDFTDERHWMPGSGNINWQELIGLLKDVGYNGPFMNEVRVVEDENKTDKNFTLSELKKANNIILDKYF